MSTATFLQKYKILNKIGEGSFSEVLKCQDLRMGSFMAAKRLKKRFNNWDEVNDCAEVITMHKLPKHPNILHMTEFHFDSFLGKVTFLFELMDMSLYDFINMRKKHVHEARAKYYLYQILCGLDHLHKHGMFHRDIKPENILLKLPVDDESDSIKYEIIKIADLGSLKGIYSTPPFTEYISTRWYRSPECLLTSGYYGTKMDIWATGCVFYELLTFKPLFAGSNEVDQLSKIHKILGTPSKRTMIKFVTNKSCNYECFPKQTGKGLPYLIPNVSNDGQNILKLMITYDPDSRCNVRRLLCHKYFKHLRDSDNHTGCKQLSSSEPVGDYKSSNISGRKSLTSQNMQKYEKRHKRTYYEMQNSQNRLSKEKSGKIDNNKSQKRSYNDMIVTKKLKICDSQKNYIKGTAEYEEPKPKVYKIYKPYPKNDHTETKTIYEAKCAKTNYDSHNDVKSSKVYYRKYFKARKESENYRNTTGNIPLLFNKIPDKVKTNTSKSFVEKKSNKASGSNLGDTADVSKLRPRPPPKVYVVDSIKNVKNSRKT